MIKRKKKKTYGFGYSQNLKPNLKGSLEYSVEHKDHEATLRLGLNHKFDTDTSLKTRLQFKSKQDMRMGFVLKQNLNASTRVTLTSDLNARLLFDRVKDSGVGHQFSAGISFFD